MFLLTEDKKVAELVWAAPI